MDEQMSLPVGTTYDFVIKAKAEEIDAAKQSNNRMMDDLIKKLGYMDYRDALACNRYIIEAKRSKNYHQFARGKVLEHAMSLMGTARRKAFEERMAAEAAEKGETDVAAYKFDVLLNKNPELAEMYQEAHAQNKFDNEGDEQLYQRVHDRFLRYGDKAMMENKIKDKRFDHGGPAPDSEDEAFSTDFDIDVDIQD